MHALFISRHKRRSRWIDEEKKEFHRRFVLPLKKGEKLGRQLSAKSHLSNPKKQKRGEGLGWNYMSKSLFDLRSIEEKGVDLGKLKRHIKEVLRRHKIGIREEISEGFLKEIFLEVKEKITQKTKYKVMGIGFPKDHLFALLFWKRDWNRFLRYVRLSQSKTERERTELSWKREYSEEKMPPLEKWIGGTKGVLIPLMEETYFLIGLRSMNRETLGKELTHYFEKQLDLDEGTFKHIWK